MKEQQQESGLERQEAVTQWIEVARTNAEAASRLLGKNPLRTHALYWIQQSMEAATKALARSKGKSHEEVYGHNLLELLLSTLQKTIEDSDGTEYANYMISQHYYKAGEYDVADHLQRALSLASSPNKTEQQNQEQKQIASKLYESALTASPEEVEILLNLWLQSSRAITQTSKRLRPLKNKRVSLDIALSERDPSQSLVKQTLVQCLGDEAGRALHETEIQLFEQLEELLAFLIRSQDQPLVVIDGNQIIQHYDKFLKMQSANLGILTTGGIVWPHESYHRYPAPPGAPESLAEAAKKGLTGRRMLGKQHYTDRMGAIKHIQRISEQARKTANLLRQAHQSGWM